MQKQSHEVINHKIEVDDFQKIAISTTTSTLMGEYIVAGIT